MRNIPDLRANRIQVLEDLAFEFDSGFVHAKPTFFLNTNGRKNGKGFETQLRNPRYFSINFFLIFYLSFPGDEVENDARCDGLSHVADCESSERRKFRVLFSANGARGLDLYDRHVSGLDEIGILLRRQTGLRVFLLHNLRYRARQLCGVQVEDGV